MENETAKSCRVPIADAMQKYRKDGAMPFHTPGHKQGRGAHARLRELIAPAGLGEEVSLMDELDDLHDPTMCISEAQSLAAKLYGADAAFFMVNGTTGAIHAMLMAALCPGDVLLVPRNAHRSLVGGMVLAGIVPVFIQPEIHEGLGIAMGLSPESVWLAMERHPEAKAIAVVHPTYYGVASDLAAISAMAHARGMLVLADEAHGAHLRFTSRLPKQALDCGADMAAQSTHKLLGSLTQTSMLLVREGRMDMGRVRRAASLLQSTSPNYLLLASLDIARLQMEERGKELWENAVELAEWLHGEINRIDGLRCFGQEEMTTPGACALDLTKITVQVDGLGLTGSEAAAILRHAYKIACELVGANHVLFLLSYADTKHEASALLSALRALAGERRKKNPAPKPVPFPHLPPVRLSPRDAFFAPAASVRIEDAVGKISAEQVMFYPPGIPVIAPGEEITQESIAYIRDMQRLGMRVTGPQDTTLRNLRVICP